LVLSYQGTKDIYKCSRYCAINETCESIPDAVEGTDGTGGFLRYITDNSPDPDPTDYNNNESGPLGRANPKFDNIFSQTNMANNIKPGYCPPFTKSEGGKCVYYTDGKVYDYNGGEVSPQLMQSTTEDTPLFQISETCHLQPTIFQENIELFHACEEWYLQPTNNPDKPGQNNLDKCMSDISQGGNTMNNKKYSIPDLKLKVEKNNDIVFENRTKINERFASGGTESCQINDQGSESNGKSCFNFVTDYIVRENYYKTYKENNIDNEGLQKLNEYHIGPRSHNGEYVENNPIHNSKIGINPPSPLEPHLGGDYVAKDFIGKYEYAKYVNPNDIFDSDGITYDDDINTYKTDKLQPMYEQPDNTPPADSLYRNINRYINEGECATTEGTPNNWPFLGFISPSNPPGSPSSGGQ